MISLPKLISVQWKVNTTVAAGSTTNTNIATESNTNNNSSSSITSGVAIGTPTAILKLRVEGEQDHVKNCPPRQR